jgi:thioredoxin-like negative regulator of GroEL
MESIKSIEEIKNVIEKSTIALFYFSTENCNVCTTLKPKLELLLESFPEVVSRFINIEKLPETSGMFTIFSVPTFILMIEGKETLRESRNISLIEFKEKLSRYYSMLF